MRSKQFLYASVSAAVAASGFVALSAAPARASVTTSITSFPYSQAWADPGLITANDDWSGVVGVQGYLGQDITTVVGADPQTVLGESASATDTDVVANGAPTSTAGGVLEVNGDTIALQGSGTADAPYVAFRLDLTGQSGVTFGFDARDIDAGADNTNQQIAVQYRVGSAGNYTNLPDGYIADASDGPSLTKTTPVSVALPALVNGQADVFVRVITTNASGSDEWIGIDNISITTGGVVDPDPEPDPLVGNGQADITTTVGALVSAQFGATGGTEPFGWSATGLPAGLTLSSDGALSGSPTEEGAFAVTATVTDSSDPVQSDDVNFTITVGPEPSILPIATLQGDGERSPYAPETGNAQGSEAVTTAGVVTGIHRDPAFANSGFDGFYLQTGGTGSGEDATPGASDGIFVYGASAIPSDLEIGDSVRVTGRVSEFYDFTELNAFSNGVVPLATPLAPVTPLATAYPTTDEGREALESMLLAPTDDFTVSNAYSTNQYGEVGLATGTEPLKQPTEYADPTDEAAIQAIRDENAARAVVLDDGTGVNYLGNQTTKGQPVPWLTVADGNANPAPPRVGAGVTLHAPVLLDYRNDTWKFQPTSPVYKNGADVATFEDTRAGDQFPQNVGGDLTIATFNVLNYFNTTGEAYEAAGPLQNPPLDTDCSFYTDRQSNRIGNNTCGVVVDGENLGNGPRGAATDVSLARQEAKLVHTINALGADIIALEEIENSIKLPGETNRDDALANLVGILNDAAGAGTWAYAKSPGSALTASAVAEQDVIRSAYIYKKDVVETIGQSDLLFGTTEFSNAREPLAQAFKAKGAPDSDGFVVIANHFKSKGDNASPRPLAEGDNAADDEVGAFNGDRVRQATRLVEYADDFAASRDLEAVFLVGDFNSYTMEQPVGVITGAGYTLVESDTEGEESYSFSGLSGSLDHVFANDAAFAMVTGADIWEINANEAASFQYSRYNYNVTDFWLPNQPWATSDHNPEIVGIDVPDFTPTSYKEIQVIGTNDFHGRLLPDGGNAAGAAPFATAVEELRTENPNTLFVAAGDLVGASTFESFIQDDEPTIDALNAMGLDVSAAGNHEFDRGYDDLENRIRASADWEYIASNLAYDETIPEEDQLAKTWTTTVDGVQIGFVGAVTEDLPALVNPAGIEGITVTDIVDATNAAAAGLRTAGADLVILLVHEGAPTTDCTSPNFTDPATVWGNIVVNTSPDVDAIVSGHTHLAYNCRYPVADWVLDGRAVNRRPVVSAGQYGTNLNQLVFKYDETTGELVAISQDVLATAGVGYEADPTVQAIVDAAVDYAEEAGSEVLGQMEGPFKRASYTSSSGATENRGGESTLSNQVAEVQRWATDEAGIDTDIAFMNPGGLRADMLGSANTEDPTLQDLSYRQAADVQPFANTLVNLDLTGAQLETVLEQQWQRTATGGVPSRPFLRLGVSEGFTYTYTETPVTVSVPNAAPVSTFQGEVTGMWLDGEPIDPAATYSVTVNSFLGGGGDNFWEFANGSDKVDTGQIDLQAMVDYMAQFDPTSSADATPLPVDYSQRAVEVTFPEGAPASYGEGDPIAFDVASWSMSAAGDVQDTELELRDGSVVLGTFPVANTAGTTPYDNTGTASVTVTLPTGLNPATARLVLVGVQTGTEIAVPVALDPPTVANEVAPLISGMPKLGGYLTATSGTWSPTPTSYAYRWFADGVELVGQTGTSLKLTKDHVGHRITVEVTASLDEYQDGVAVSEPTEPVVKGNGKGNGKG